MQYHAQRQVIAEQPAQTGGTPKVVVRGMIVPGMRMVVRDNRWSVLVREAAKPTAFQIPCMQMLAWQQGEAIQCGMKREAERADHCHPGVALTGVGRRVALDTEGENTPKQDEGKGGRSTNRNHLRDDVHNDNARNRNEQKTVQ